MNIFPIKRFLISTKNFDSAKTLQPKMILFLIDGPEYKRKCVMFLKKDLSFPQRQLRLTPFLGSHALHTLMISGSIINIWLLRNTLYFHLQIKALGLSLF